DGRDPWFALEAGVIIGDQGDVDITHGQLACQGDLRILGHIDDFPALSAEPLALGARGKTWALNNDHRAAIVNRDAQLPPDGGALLAKLRAIRLGRGNVHHSWPVVKRLLAPVRAVDELIAHDEVARL